jgi:hypothetical protein
MIESLEGYADRSQMVAFPMSVVLNSSDRNYIQRGSRASRQERACYQGGRRQDGAPENA